MKLTSFLMTSLMTVSIFGGSSAMAAPIELQFWHPALGPIDVALQKQISAFNASQADYKVVSSARGTYDETLNAMIAAYRAGKQPHLLTAIGQETLTLQLSGAIVPVQDVFTEAGIKVDYSGYMQPISNYYLSKDGKLMSLPFSPSTPILWYNRDAFAKAGLNRAPENWDEVGEYAAKLKASGMQCGYATAWQQWVHIDNYLFMQNKPVSTKRNGVDGLDTEFQFNKGPAVKHLARVQSWAKDGLYEYAGRQGSSAMASFVSGRCGMITHSSAIFASVRNGAKFAYGAAMMPIEAGTVSGPSLIGGGSIWAIKGHKPQEYKGVAAFLAFLSSGDAQATWHQDTGYLPSTRQAYEKTKATGYYNQFPAQEVAIRQLLRGSQASESTSVRMGGSSQYVAAIEEELENLWSGKKTSQQSLDDAARRGNEVLRRFERQNAANK